MIFINDISVILSECLKNIDPSNVLFYVVIVLLIIFSLYILYVLIYTIVTIQFFYQYTTTHAYKQVILMGDYFSYNYYTYTTSGLNKFFGDMYTDLIKYFIGERNIFVIVEIIGSLLCIGVIIGYLVLRNKCGFPSSNSSEEEALTIQICGILIMYFFLKFITNILQLMYNKNNENIHQNISSSDEIFDRNIDRDLLREIIDDTLNIKPNYVEIFNKYYKNIGNQSIETFIDASQTDIIKNKGNNAIDKLDAEIGFGIDRDETVDIIKKIWNDTNLNFYIDDDQIDRIDEIDYAKDTKAHLKIINDMIIKLEVQKTNCKSEQACAELDDSIKKLQGLIKSLNNTDLANEISNKKVKALFTFLLITQLNSTNERKKIFIDEMWRNGNNTDFSYCYRLMKNELGSILSQIDYDLLSNECKTVYNDKAILDKVQLLKTKLDNHMIALSSNLNKGLPTPVLTDLVLILMLVPIIISTIKKRFI